METGASAGANAGAAVCSGAGSGAEAGPAAGKSANALAGAGAGTGAGAGAGTSAFAVAGAGASEVWVHADTGAGADYLTPWLISVDLEEPLSDTVAPGAGHVAAVIVLQNPGAVALAGTVFTSDVRVEVIVQHLQQKSQILGS